MHKRYDKDFQAKVALEVIRGEKTLQEIEAAYSVHPNLVSRRKKPLLESAGRLFEKDRKDKTAEEAEKQQHELFRQIGQLQAENEFLKKVQAALRDRAQVADPDNPGVTISRQRELLELSRTFYYCQAHEGHNPELALLEAILTSLRSVCCADIRRSLRRLATSARRGYGSGGLCARRVQVRYSPERLLLCQKVAPEASLSLAG